MKKSNALMISYMIFLALSILANLLFDWQGLDRIAMAATIAGFFFAISDYFGWKASFLSNAFKRYRSLTDLLLEYTNVNIETLDTQNKILSNAIDVFSPHKDEIEDINLWICDAVKTIDKNDKNKTQAQKTISTVDDLYLKINKGFEHGKKTTKIETIFVILGFVSFFMVVAFDYLGFIITPYQSFATIGAFILIMLNYYLKDVYEEKKNREIDELEKQVEEKKQQAHKNNEETKRLTLEIEKSLAKFNKNYKSKK